jgi:hypothetical protein
VLTDLSGFGNLTEVGTLYIESNSALEAINGFDQLRDAGSLVIGYNTALTNLRGFGQIERIGYGLYVYENPVLPTCEVEWLIDQIGANDIGYTYVINNDDSGVCP